jgi:hypothetical protein
VVSKIFLTFALSKEKIITTIKKYKNYGFG